MAHNSASSVLHSDLDNVLGGGTPNSMQSVELSIEANDEAYCLVMVP